MAHVYTIVIRSRRGSRRILSTHDESAARFWYGRAVPPKHGAVLLFRDTECIEGDQTSELPPAEFEKPSFRWST